MNARKNSVKKLSGTKSWRSAYRNARTKIRRAFMTFVLLLRKGINKSFSKESRERIHNYIHRIDTKEGQKFDIILFFLIVASVIVVMLESITEFHDKYWWSLYILEWIFTLVFTIEYLFRIYSSKDPIKYVTSYYGIIDLVSIMPAYLSIILTGSQHLLIIRSLRLTRIFRVFKLSHFISEGSEVVQALRSSSRKIFVFFSFIILISILIGSFMYMIEGDRNAGFSNIPKGIYWTVTTLTTVGYGDVVPSSPFGKFFTTLVMILGYGIIAVPTGIVTAEISQRVLKSARISRDIVCPRCHHDLHLDNSNYCSRCGSDIRKGIV